MQFLELAQKRYTTKKYNPNLRVSEDKIEALKEIIRLSPSSINSQPWKFVFVSDANVKATLAEASLFNAPKVLESSHLVVFNAIDNLDLFEQQAELYLAEYAVGYYRQFIKTKPEHEVKSWLQHQVYLALGFFLGACASLDIDTTTMEGIQTDKYREILGLTDYKTLFAVALGVRDENDSNQPTLKPKTRKPEEVVIEMI